MPNIVGAHLLFGQRVRTQRVYRRRLSQREFCVAAQVDPYTLSKIEQGIHTPWDEATIRRVASVLEAEPDDLLALARAWLPPPPEEERPHTIAGSALYRPCLVCGDVITDKRGFHETGGNRVICAHHLVDPRAYWQGEGSS